MSAVLILAAIIGSALTQTWRELLGTRVLLGIGMGAKASVVPVFVSILKIMKGTQHILTLGNRLLK